MPRFFVTASNIFGGTAYINEKDAEHLRVLRIRQGEVFTVCDANGTDYLCSLTKTDGKKMTAKIIKTIPSAGEPSVHCSVFAAYSKGDKMDTVVQKCIEIGASEIIVFPSFRCVSRPDDLAAIKKTSRWQKIAHETAKQANRGKIPTVTAAKTFESAIELAAKADLPLFLYENEDKLSFKSAFEQRPDCKSISIVTGPEGGFEPKEASLAADAGMLSVSLGPRILRCETAPLCALSAIMALTNNL